LFSKLGHISDPPSIIDHSTNIAYLRLSLWKKRVAHSNTIFSLKSSHRSRL
jgi:hypothetical protein